MIKDDEFNAAFEDYCEDLKVEYVESATKRLKVDKIDLSTETE